MDRLRFDERQVARIAFIHAVLRRASSCAPGLPLPGSKRRWQRSFAVIPTTANGIGACARCIGERTSCLSSAGVSLKRSRHDKKRYAGLVDQWSSHVKARPETEIDAGGTRTGSDSCTVRPNVAATTVSQRTSEQLQVWVAQSCDWQRIVDAACQLLRTERSGSRRADEPSPTPSTVFGGQNWPPDSPLPPELTAALVDEPQIDPSCDLVMRHVRTVTTGRRLAAINPTA